MPSIETAMSPAAPANVLISAKSQIIGNACLPNVVFA